MLRKSAIFTLLLACVALLLAGCGTVPPGAPGERGGTDKPNNASFGLDRFSPGQKLMIEFTDVPGAPPPFTQTILENGEILLPLGKRVKAGGKRKAELVEEIRNLYVPGYYQRLTVNIQTEDRWYFVGGEVKTPGQKVYVADLTVSKAIQAAGDFTNFAKENAVEITRADGQFLKVDCKKARQNARYDVPIYPGDSINVPRSWY
ncbi:MAG TPA: polysaccharide biosynthesis/export family protein [Methylomirabilota bacterium]|nr:polysaccharide biosynthesis/export family protein [Methylomirabilota bacterium]